MTVWLVFADDGEVLQALDMPEGTAPRFNPRSMTHYRVLNSPVTRASLRHALNCLEIGAKTEINQETMENKDL